MLERNGRDDFAPQRHTERRVEDGNGGPVLVGHRGGSFPFAWGVDRLSVIRFEIVHMYVCLPVYVANICEYE